MQEIDGPVPEHLREHWGRDQLWCFHSAAWLRRHWERTGIVDVELADDMPDGWRLWLEWHRAVAPDNKAEIEALEADRGRHLGYVRAVGRRRAEVNLEESGWPEAIRIAPQQYVKKPLLRA